MEGTNDLISSQKEPKAVYLEEPKAIIKKELKDV